jgi:hypothetical protein
VELRKKVFVVPERRGVRRWRRLAGLGHSTFLGIASVIGIYGSSYLCFLHCGGKHFRQYEEIRMVRGCVKHGCVRHGALL